MAAILKEIEDQALSLTPRERGELIHRLIVSLEGEAEDTPEAIAQAWDEEIARRVADMDVGIGGGPAIAEVFCVSGDVCQPSRTRQPRPGDASH